MRHFRLNPEGIYAEDDLGTANRAFLFGDGIFETMVFANGQIRFGKDHQERLMNGFRQLRISADAFPDIHRVEALIRELPEGRKSCRVRWNLYRAGSGKYTPSSPGHEESLMLTEFQPAPKVKKAAYFCTSIHLQNSPWANCKTLNALPYVMANLERQEKGMDEVILMDAWGHVSEAGSSNIFWIKNDIYYTPSLEKNCVAGVARKQILRRIAEVGKSCKTGSFSADHLLDADQVFVSNVSGISYIEEIADRRFSCRPVAEIESIFTLT
ncbi:branched-chain amino acid aminotransferase [Cyclobacterium lianum]|uniref:branched-chain-amino-acid transaminase n=1 Tax=Cyclobacterium lianum TaxID=388280 RepID=A0A1M7MRK8_9BACT|nr:aminotransferase class IV [Cyclobacterium lianum]SHM93151.1 branched-chain amino acid aminotransferase [Cyclobacterium lianum]